MALLIADSFDLYATGDTTDLWVIGPWTGRNGSFPYDGPVTVATSPTRFSTGKSVTTQFGSNFYKSLASPSTNTVFFSGAFYPNYAISVDTTTMAYISFVDTSTTQVQIIFRRDGAIVFSRNGTTIATYSNAYVGNTWAQWQFKVVFSPTVGEVRARKNGSSTDDFVATGLNTMATANAYANVIMLGASNTGGSSISSYFDDVMLFDNSGLTLNDWTGDIRTYISTPSAAGSAADFTATYTPQTYANASAGSTNTLPANRINYCAFTPTANTTVTKITVPLSAGATGNAVMAIYSDNTSVPGTPDALVATSDTVTNPISGNNDFTFSSPPSLTANTKYYYAIWTDASIVFFASGNSDYQTKTYGTGFPANASTTSFYNGGMMVTITYSAANYAMNMQVPPDGDVTYTRSLTVGAHDLFQMSNLPVTPSYIYAVTQRVIARKTQSGTRLLQTELKSGATTVNGSSQDLGTSYGGVITSYTQDPNTGGAWTTSAVNGLEAGYKLSG